MQIKNLLWPLLMAAFILPGCSSSMHDDPRAFPDLPDVPKKGAFNVPEPGPGPALPLNSNIPVPEPKDRPMVSLVNMDGSVLTTWARGPGSVLWAYQIRDSNTFGNQRNWRVRPGTRPGTVQFQNVDNNQCITSVLTEGIAARYLMLTADCSFGPDRFDMQLLQTQNGNYLIKSFATGRCARAEFLDRTPSSPYATTITVDKCPVSGESTFEFMWSISEPIGPALAVLPPAASK